MSHTALLSPLKLGAITIPNRITMSALTRSRSVPTNVPNALNVEHYIQRAAAGLIVTEGILVSQQGTEWTHAPGIWNDEQVAGWKKVTAAVHSKGGQIFGQLWHVGRVAHPDAPDQKAAGIPVYAPSAVSARGGKFRFIEGAPGYVTPTAVEDPATIVALFKAAAVNAKEAGFDGVELHGANGYIVTQFLDNTSNLRTDKWGGSVENRSRFGLEILKAWIEVWGADRVAIRLSPAGGYNDMGMPYQDTVDTYSHFIKEADALGIAYIVLLRKADFFDPKYGGVPRSTDIDVLTVFRPFVKNAKLILNVDVTPEEGEILISSGKIDAIAIGRQYMSHPDLVERVKAGKPLDTNITWQNVYGWEAPEEELRVGYNDYPVAA